MTSELSTAASYYLLVLDRENNDDNASNITKSNASIPGAKTTATGKEYGRFESSSSKEEGNWEIAEWTEQDEIEAEELLRSHLEKCTISSLDNDTHDEGENWNKFYHDNGTRFFKDRHYFAKAFPHEFAETGQKGDKTLFELGCGVGNACLPLLEEENSPWKTIHAMDISAEAIELLRQERRFISCNESTHETGRRIVGHVCDISKSFPEECQGVADVTTLIFCLSALDPDDMPTAARHIASSLKPGGTLLVRDYGRYDEAQMKLGTSRNKRIKDNFYRKHDGTKVYYFSLEDLDKLFVEAGLKVVELYFLRRLYGNKASGETRRRIWVQGRFTKPM